MSFPAVARILLGISLLTISNIYLYKDNLGNTRVSLAKSSAGVLEVTDTNNYYPFGLNHISEFKGLLGGYLNYKYNGKELQETGMYDYGARFYMPDLGRWGVVDALAEKYRRWSVYNYVMNNPIRNIDPDGQDVVPWFVNSFDDRGRMVATKNYATKAFNKAMTDFAKTSYGKNYLLQFMKKGQSIYGLKARENGKHSDKNLNLINMNLRYASGLERGQAFIDSDGVWEGKISYPSASKKGEKQEDLNVYFDTLDKNQIELGETIVHELGLHGNNYENYLEAVENGESIDM